MCHMGYRVIGSGYFATWGEWVDAVNANQRYCKELPKHRLREYRFKCPYWELPSFHPFWRRSVHLKAMKDGQRHIDNLKACEKDPGLIKVLYNSSTTIWHIRRMVEAVPKRRQDW